MKILCLKILDPSIRQRTIYLVVAFALLNFIKRGKAKSLKWLELKKWRNTKAAADFVASELHFAITALFNLELSTQKLAGCNHPLLAPPTMDEWSGIFFGEYQTITSEDFSCIMFASHFSNSIQLLVCDAFFLQTLQRSPHVLFTRYRRPTRVQEDTFGKNLIEKKARHVLLAKIGRELCEMNWEKRERRPDGWFAPVLFLPFTPSYPFWKYISEYIFKDKKLYFLHFRFLPCNISHVFLMLLIFSFSFLPLYYFSYSAILIFLNKCIFIFLYILFVCQDTDIHHFHPSAFFQNNFLVLITLQKLSDSIFQTMTSSSQYSLDYYWLFTASIRRIT